MFHLGVEEHVLQDIDGDPLRGSRSLKALKAWLDRDLEASWKKLVSGKECSSNSTRHQDD